MTIDFTTLSPWLHLVELIVIVGLWLRKPGESAEKLAEKLASRLDVLEERVRHMPTSDELTELRGSVKAIEAQIDGVKDKVDATSEAIVRIEHFLRENR